MNKLFELKADVALCILAVTLSLVYAGVAAQPLFLIISFFVTWFSLKVLVPTSTHQAVHSLIYGITLVMAGSLVYLMYKDNEKSLLYGFGTFVLVFILQSFMLKQILRSKRLP